MLLIILSWSYILFTTINLGVGLDKLIVSKNKNFVITSLLGLFSATILGSIWAVFGRINIEFHSFLLLLNGILFFKFKTDIAQIYHSFLIQFNRLPFSLKFYLILIAPLIIAQCATAPYIIDNETYYIQTIKWLNEYGFVKGLANLNILLAQTSGWHITQSIFNFSFLYKNFNDISGFCLLLGNIFAVFKLNMYFENKNKVFLTVGLLPLANVLLFQFISAPSPDLPVYVISFILFFYFLEELKTAPSERFTVIVLLSLFVLYIKVIAVGFLVLPLFFMIQNFKILRPKLFTSFTFAMLILGLFITKNLIITGYPFYPTQLFSFRTYDFSVPKELVSYFFNDTKFIDLKLSQSEWDSLSGFQIFIKWFMLNKINTLFYIAGFILIVVSPYIIYKFHNKKFFWYLYLIMLFQLVILFVTAPQFRFFIHFILFFGFLVLACILENKKTITALLFGSVSIVIILLFLPVKFTALTHNKLIAGNSYFTLNEFIFPHKNSKMQVGFRKMKIGNINFSSPDKNAYFWTNGDGNLPCINVQQLDYFKTYFHYIPQMRTDNLKDGFYTKKLSSND